jgi:hypothetical protein
MRVNRTLWIFKALGFIDQQANTGFEYSKWIYKFNFGIIFLFLKFCGPLDIESREIWDERRNMTERVQVDYHNGHLFEVYYLGTVKYSLSAVQFRNELDRCWLLGFFFNIPSCAVRQLIILWFNSEWIRSWEKTVLLFCFLQLLSENGFVHRGSNRRSSLAGTIQPLCLGFI